MKIRNYDVVSLIRIRPTIKDGSRHTLVGEGRGRGVKNPPNNDMHTGIYIHLTHAHTACFTWCVHTPDLSWLGGGGAGRLSEKRSRHGAVNLTEISQFSEGVAVEILRKRTFVKLDFCQKRNVLLFVNVVAKKRRNRKLRLHQCSWEPEPRNFFLCVTLGLFNFVITVFQLGVLYPEHAQLAFEKI